MVEYCSLNSNLGSSDQSLSLLIFIASLTRLCSSARSLNEPNSSRNLGFSGANASLTKGHKCGFGRGRLSKENKRCFPQKVEVTANNVLFNLDFDNIQLRIRLHCCQMLGISSRSIFFISFTFLTD